MHQDQWRMERGLAVGSQPMRKGEGISSRSIGSKWCLWELTQAVEQKKRQVPVVLEDIDFRKLPHALGDTHLLSFAKPNDYEVQTSKLIDAINTNLPWLQERTWLDDWARRWQRRSKPASLLLRDDELDSAKDWFKKRPQGEPMLGATSEFLEISDLYKLRNRKLIQFVVAGLFFPFFVIMIALIPIVILNLLKRYIFGDDLGKELQLTSEEFVNYFVGAIGFLVTVAAGQRFVESVAYFRKVRDTKALWLGLAFLLIIAMIG